MFNIRKTRSSPRHPASNGQTERFNRTLWGMIRCFIKGKQEQWDLYLEALASAYNSTPHATTSFSPNLLFLGRETRMPAELGAGVCDESSDNYGEYVHKLKAKMQKAHEIARKNLKSKANYVKNNYDSKCFMHKYNVGDMVYLLNELRHIQQCPKLQPIYKGP